MPKSCFVFHITRKTAIRFNLLILDWDNYKPPDVGKKTVIILTILLVSALAILGYYLQQGRKTLFTDPYKAINQKASIVIETVDLQSFLNSLTTEKGLFGELAKIGEFKTFNLKLGFIADQLNKAGFKKIHPDGSALISFYATKKGHPDVLLCLALPGEIRIKQVKELLISSGIKKFNPAEIEGARALQVPYNDGRREDTAYIAINQGLLFIGSSEAVIGEACVQMSVNHDIRELPGFSRVLLASGKNEDKIFIVFKNLPNLVGSVFSEAGAELTKKITRIAGTAGGDIFINEDGLILSGYTESTDTSQLLYRFKSVTPAEFHTYKILPSSTVLFETVIMPDLKSGQKQRNTVSTPASVFAEKLREFTGEELTRAYINIKGRPAEENTLIIYELSNRVQAEQLFLQETGSNTEVSYFEPDEQTRIPVYRTAFSGMVNCFIPGFATGCDDTYFAFYDNFLVTGSSFVTISRLLYDNILKKTLENNLIYRDFESTLPSRAAYFFYCVPARITDYLSGFLNQDLVNSLRLNRASISKIQSAGYQLAESNGMIYNSLSIRFREEVREESSTEWETLLDTTAAIKPFFFTNHITGAKEIFIQDIKNNTYLINAAGRVLWKVPLNERITGNVFMVDYFRNGKFQLLFSGHNYLHMLDRNGNYVERYPVKLRSPASNSLSLFDYDNNLNYRIFIAGEDKLIYSYEKTGNVVKGWTPFRTSGIVTSEVDYFKISGKDYLVASDENSLYYLDRSGKKRLTLKEGVTRARGSSLRLIPGSEPYLVCSSPDGTVQQIYFDGSVKKFIMKKFSGDHSFDIFDVDGNGFGEYIFIDSGMLYLYDHNHREMCSREFGSADLGGPISFIFSSSDRKIGVFDIDKKLIYLVDKNGETMNGFPLRGASMFSIGKLSDKSGWHLIVGGTDRFLYNYRIDTGIK